MRDERHRGLMHTVDQYLETVSPGRRQLGVWWRHKWKRQRCVLAWFEASRIGGFELDREPPMLSPSSP